MKTWTNSFQIFAESQEVVSFVDNPVKSRGGSRGGEKGNYSSPSLSLLAVICSRFFVVEVIFFVCLFLLRMNTPQTYQRNIDKYIH